MIDPINTSKYLKINWNQEKSCFQLQHTSPRFSISGGHIFPPIRVYIYIYLFIYKSTAWKIIIDPINTLKSLKKKLV